MARFDPLTDLAGRFARPLFEAVLGVQNAPHQMWRFTAIAQSHLDAAWKWRVFQTKSKAKQTFKNIKGMQLDAGTIGSRKYRFLRWFGHGE